MNAVQHLPPRVDLGQPVLTPVKVATPQAAKIVYTVVGLFFLAAIPYGLLKPSAMHWSDGVNLPGWTAYLGLPVCAAIGWLCLAMVYRSGLTLTQDAVTSRTPFGGRTLTLTEVTRVRAQHKVTHTGGVWHRTLIITLEKDGLPAVVARQEFTQMDALAELAVRWWIARPELVTDPETANLLSEVAHAKAAAQRLR